MKQRWIGLFVVAAMAVGADGLAQELSLRGGFSGNWYDPEQSGQGVQIEVINPRQAVVAWYTYDSGGDLLWLFGVGEIRGDSIEVELERFSGGAFPPAFDPELVQSEPWGTAKVTFDSCTEASMSWATGAAGFTGGTMPLVRLTGIQGLRCGQAESFEHTIELSLDAGPGRWEALFADYPDGHDIEEEAGWALLPAPLADRHGFLLAGTSPSGDLAMFLKHPLGGLLPDTEYRVELEMTFATNVPQDCFGAGGSPGESVHVKLGASGVEPVVLNDDGFFRLNIDKGAQFQGGEDAIRVGDMAGTQPEELCNRSADWQWELKTVSTQGSGFTAITDGEGKLWVYGGTDSGFEGRTTYFVTDFTARLSPGAEQ